MCFRTSVFICSGSNHTLANTTTTTTTSSYTHSATRFGVRCWQAAWVNLKQQQCLTYLLLILTLLAQLTGISTAASKGVPSVAGPGPLWTNGLRNTTSHAHGHHRGSHLHGSVVEASNLVPYPPHITAPSVAGPWPWAPAPIRHWWAQHHKRSASSSSRVLSSSAVTSSSPPFVSSHQQPDTHQQKCLRYLQYVPEESVLRVKNGADWSNDVCSTYPLDKRVKKMLLASPCDQHRVCQVLSPQDLQQIASDKATCIRNVDSWWKKFHNISRALLDFDYVFTTSLDIDKYSVSHDINVEECKVRHLEFFQKLECI